MLFGPRYLHLDTAGIQVRHHRPKAVESDIVGHTRIQEELALTLKTLQEPAILWQNQISPRRAILIEGPNGTGKSMVLDAFTNACLDHNMSVLRIDGLCFKQGSFKWNAVKKTLQKNQVDVLMIDDLHLILNEVDLDLAALLSFNSDNDSNNGSNKSKKAKRYEGPKLTVMTGLTQDTSDESKEKYFCQAKHVDLRVELNLPNETERLVLLQLAVAKTALSSSINLLDWARELQDYTGRDLFRFIDKVKYAALKDQAFHKQKIRLLQRHFEAIIMEQHMGQALSVVRSEEDELLCAVHEAGHTLVCVLMETETYFVRTTIKPHQEANGMTFHIWPEHKLKSKRHYEESLCRILAGFLAEKLLLSHRTEGSRLDLDDIQEIITEEMIPEGLLPSSFKDDPRKVEKYIDRLRQRTRRFLRKHEVVLCQLSCALVLKKTLDRAQVLDIVFPKDKKDNNYKKRKR